MFSMTTMASSTTRPVATTSASSVMTLIEKPTAQMAASVPMSDTGMEIAGAMVARNERRKARMMRMTMTLASRRLMITSRTDSRMNMASSRRDGDVDAGRQRLAQLVHGGVHALGNVDGVGLRLADDVDADRRLAVEARDRRRFLEAPAHEGDVLDLGLRIDLQVADVLGRGDRRLGAHQQLLRGVLERARRRRRPPPCRWPR